MRWWYPFSWGLGSGLGDGEEGDGFVRVLEHVEPVAVCVDLEFAVVRVDELPVAAHLEGQGRVGQIIAVDLGEHVVLVEPGDGHVLLAGIVRRVVVVGTGTERREREQGEKTGTDETATLHERCLRRCTTTSAQCVSNETPPALMVI